MPLEVLDYRTDVRNVFITPEIRSRFQRLEPGTVTPLHSHDLGHEVWVVMDGEVEFEIAGERAVVRPGQMIVARTDEPHVLRVVGDAPATVYLSVTPHIVPTHTFLDEAGDRLPTRYARFTTLREGEREEAQNAEPVESLIQRQVATARALANAAGASASAQESAASDLRRALESDDSAAAKAAVDAMWTGIAATYRSLHDLLLVWNELAPQAASPEPRR